MLVLARELHTFYVTDAGRRSLQCRRPGFDSWVGKIPWRRKWQPTPVFLLGESRGQRSLVGYSLWGRKESDSEQLKKKKILCTVSYCYQQRACSVLYKSSKNMTDVELSSPSKSCSDIMGKRTKLPSNQKPAGATPQSMIPNLYYSHFTGKL